MKNSQNIKRYVIAAALAGGLASSGLAASAQVAGTAIPTKTTDGTNVSMSTTSVDSRAARQARLEQINADERRVEFRFLGTSL